MLVKETVIRPIGNSAGVSIPKAMLEHLKLEKGDKVYLRETKEGVLVTPYSESFSRAMDAFAEGMKRYRNAMRELAKN
jgi:putative addiction module antidote